MKTFLLILAAVSGWGAAKAQYGAVMEVLDLPYWPEIKMCAAYRMEYTTLHGKGIYTTLLEKGLKKKVVAIYTADSGSGGYTEHIDSLYEYTDADHYQIRAGYKLGTTETIKVITVARGPGAVINYRYNDGSAAETCMQYQIGKTRTDSCITSDRRQRVVSYYNEDGLLHRKAWYRMYADNDVGLTRSVQLEYIRDEQQRIKKVTAAYYQSPEQEYTFNYYYTYDPDKITILKFTDGIPLQQEQLVLRRDGKGYLKSFEHTKTTTKGKARTTVNDSQGTFSCQ